ncbi:AAA family ATPase [Bradyrhizobium liaoningense]|uniref:AAA family ATPase n=1 Tax=Bradyrhizobium liaoningense TaxID=43992 RepID=UPI001BABCDE5|nr:AAA family ATPase [Bradyrhizobium liaoningense]MBR0716504.1 AAA family ATPase [Bradyrhizobium liaoningense]
MVQQSPNVAYSEASSQVLWEDGERVFSRGWRLDDNGNRLAVLLVAPAADHPSRSRLDRLTHEYELKDELDSAWAARPLALMRDAGRTVLVLDDLGGEPLDRLLGGPMEVGRFLRLAIAVTAALGKLHQRGLIHKDIKPANIVVNCADGYVRLTGFGIASRLSRERQAPEPPETIAGTLAYMAPEQTGRMNRSIDARSDLYALGVTLYQMLTGVLPLTAADPTEWVHCHIARKPVPPVERLESIPAPVSAIIMKLLAKTPEDRYQTAGGVERDLRCCLAEWEARRRIDDFPLGLQDTPNQLLIPEKLYGRDREIATLLSCFDRIIKTGVPELVLVSGYSGIGKSSVVDELHKALVPQRSLFASGKFDQYKRDIPYATLVQAFQSLVRSLLSKSESELASWRHALLEALGSNGRLMIDLIPELKLIIGDQPPVPTLPPQQAQSRFQLVFRRFIGAFARSSQPLALFLDDLQWVDAATLDLLEDLLRPDLEHLMLIGAYRDNEVAAAHPLTRKLDAIKTAGGKVAEIKLSPLTQEHLGQLVADALRCELERAEPLAKLVQLKTGGNPFFAVQFLSSLVEEGLLKFDHDGARWSWDIDRIEAKGYTDNVADLMIGKLTRLPTEAQNALQQMACLGNIAESTVLSMVLGISEEQLDTTLWPARDQELVERVAAAYRFVHDRVQEAAYGLIAEQLRGEAHLRIGRLLAARTSPEKRDEATFEIVNQLNRGLGLITSVDEREQAAELNLAAGRRAKASAAYVSALSYFIAGRGLLAEGCWEHRWELIFALDLHRAECELLTGALSDAENHLAALSARVTDMADRAGVARLGIDLYLTLNQPSRSVAVGLEYLWYLGINWSPHPTDEEARQAYQCVWSELGRRATEELIALPLMTDPASLAELDVLNRLSSPAQYTDLNLYTLVVCQMLRLTLDRGNSDASAVAYGRLGMIAGLRFGEYEGAYRVGQLACELVEQRGLWRFQAGVYLNFGNMVMPWTRHIRTCCELIGRAFDAAQKTGDLVYAGICSGLRVLNLLAVGDALADIEREAERVHLGHIQLGTNLEIIGVALAIVRMLRGATARFGSLDDGQFDEQRIERDFANTSDVTAGQCLYWICKLQARFLAGDYATAVDAASRALPLLSMSLTIMEAADYHFYGALSYAAFSDSMPAGQRTPTLEALAPHYRQLASWAAACPENFEDRAALVSAEIARIDGRAFDAMNLYEQAIRSAQANGFVHNEALAKELAARFYTACGFDQIAHLYLRNARDCYLRWGADGKVRQLDAMYPLLRMEEPTPVPTSTIAASVEQLDLATVIKVSQTISSEIVLEKLLEMLMRTALEQAGAERGLLILSRGAEQRIAAEATTDGDLVTVHPRDEGVAATVLPESVLHYVLRTRESVILNDASSHNLFSADPYIVENYLRSILCFPLINQGRLAGILYLENNLTPGAFTPDRVALLTVLASQAAISLENSRLYDDLADRERKIRRLVDANIIGIFIADRRGWIIEANDAFLRLVGYRREDLVSGRMRWTELSPPEWRERDVLTQAELNSTGIVQPFEKEYFRKDGSRVPVLVGAAVFEERGDRLAFVLDLTERKRAEETLRASEAKFRAAIDGIAGLVAIMAPSGELDSVNSPLTEYFGRTVEELKNWGTSDAVHPEDLPRVLEAYARSLAAGTPFHHELRLRRFDGEYRWFENRGAPIRDESGRITRWYCLLTDIDDRTQALARLQQMQSDFAHMNRVSVMGELAASLSHEITQPIASARNNARAAQNFLKMQPPDLGEVREALSCVVGDADRAGEIIDGIREQIKKAPPRKECFDLNVAIHEVIVLVRSVTLRNGVSVKTRLAERLLPVLGDRVQLQQVLVNLILNAAEAMGSMEEGPRELLISTKENQAGVLVAVHDSGPGIDPAHLDRVFDAFYTTKFGGTGMGLSICRSIIHAHGGKLWAEANEPRGALFQFTLPGAERQLTPPPQASLPT